MESRMPLYEFACQSCEHTFEELVFADEEVTCPKCRGANIEKLLSVPGPGKVSAGSLPMSACGDPSLPPCGAPWCQRKG
jgi:putative FmdB family regulatory protein